MAAIIATLHSSSTAAVSFDLPTHQENQDGESRVELSFFAEGAANVIFSIKLLDTDSAVPLSWSHQLVNGSLLRLRKGDQDPNGKKSTAESAVPPPPYVPVLEIKDFVTNHIANVIPASHFIQHVLVEVAPQLVEQCNALLSRMDTQELRRPKRRGWHIRADEQFGFLIADMSVKGENEIMIEFKPKWLAQSPTAPDGARRCRTCAWHIMNSLPEEKRYCPLALASGHAGWVKKQASRFVETVQELPAGWSAAEVTQLMVEYFVSLDGGRDLLLLLQRLQMQWDPLGASIYADGTTDTAALLENAQQKIDDPKNIVLEKLSWAMTLRDCIIFIRLSKNPEIRLEAKLADLDLKRVKASKLLKWATDEKRLRDQGFYSGTDAGTDASGPDEICLLSDAHGRELYRS
jgi:inositol-pentakisphosphate 2-kinase